MTNQSKSFKSNQLGATTPDPLKKQFLAEYRIKIEQLSMNKASLGQIATTKASAAMQTDELEQEIAKLESTLTQYEQLILKSW